MIYIITTERLKLIKVMQLELTRYNLFIYLFNTLYHYLILLVNFVSLIVPARSFVQARCAGTA